MYLTAKCTNSYVTNTLAFCNKRNLSISLQFPLVDYNSDSEEETDKAETQDGDGYYFDLNELLRANTQFTTPHSLLGAIEHLHVMVMVAPSLKPLENEMRRIFQSEATAFKVNASFSYVLRHRTTNQYRFFYGSHGNGRVFYPARSVHNNLTRETLLEELSNLDPLNFISEGRETSVWVFEQFSAINLYIYPMEVSERSLVPISCTRWRILLLIISPFILFLYRKFPWVTQRGQLPET